MLQLPTDNLYKFMAISGLLLFGFSEIFPLLRLIELRDKQIQLGGEINVLKVETDHLSKELELQNTTNKIMLETFNEKGYQDKFWKRDKEYITFVLEQFKYNWEKAERNFENQRSLEVKNAEIETKNQLLKEVDSDIHFMRQTSLWIKVGSVIMIIYGFSFWYWKVQRLQDKIIIKEALEGKAKAKEASA